MKKLLLLIFLASVLFAQPPCPPGCECLSDIEFMERYDRPFTIEDICQEEAIECGYDEEHNAPRICFTIPEEEPEEVGSGIIGIGPNNPDDHDWYYDPDSDDIWNEMLQLRVSAGPTENIKLTGITLKAFGSGDDSTGISRIEVYHDLLGNGIVDESDPNIGTREPAYDEDNGTRKMSINLRVSADSTRYILIAYVMSPNAENGKTHGFTVEKIKAKGENSGIALELGGVPKTSSTKTVILPPPRPCIGNLTFAFNQTSALPNERIMGIAGRLVDCNNKTILIQSTQCDFSASSTCSCIVNGSGCNCSFNGPSQEGQYTYYACVDKNNNTVVDTGENVSANLVVEVEEAEEEVPECALNNECAANQRCFEGSCKEITGTCGYAANHAWIEYECGEEAGCDVCLGGEICENHECVLYKLEAPADASVGTGIVISAFRENEQAEGRDIIIRDPEGNEIKLITNESGEITFTPQLIGKYSLSIMEFSKDLIVHPKASPFDEMVSKLTLLFTEELGGTIFFLVIILIAAAIIWWHMGGGQRREKQK